MIKFIEKKIKTVEFHTLKVGETFKVPDFSSHYMKFERIVNTNGDAYNGINLNTGLLMRFDDTDNVYAVNLTAEVDIKNV